MGLFVVTGLLIFNSYARGYSPQNNSVLEVNNTQSKEVPIDFFDTSFFPYELEQTEKEIENRSQKRPNILWNIDDEDGSTTTENASEILLLNNLSKAEEKLQKSRNNYDVHRDGFQREDPVPNQQPTRREITNLWVPPEEISDGRVPENNYLYYPHDVRYLQNEYIDYPSSETNHADQKNGSLSSAMVVPESGTRREPQYYQKNYYYNYYPMVKRRYVAPLKWEPDNRSYSEDMNKRLRGTLNRKLISKNSCRQYLEFLKYAFEKLEEHPDYSYDYVEEEQPQQSNQHILTTQMMAPTFYIDSSGKFAQMNTRDNNIPNYDSYSTLPKALNSPPIEYIPSTPSFKISSSSMRPTYLPSMDGSPSPTLGTPSSTTAKDNFKIYNDPTTDNWSKNTPKIGQSYPTPRVYQLQDSVSSIAYQSSPRSEDIPKYSNRKFEEDYRSNYPELRTTTGIPVSWPSSEGYYNTIGGIGERTTEHTGMTNYVMNTTSSGIVSPYSPIISSTFQPPTRIPIPYPTDLLDRNSAEDIGFPKKDADCDDKMLPCPDTVNITYPLNGYCNKYVSCEAGRANRRTCPEGLHFNIITKSCDLPHNSFCTYFCPIPNGYFGIPGDCGGYFVCRNSVPEYRMCPPQMHWDIKKRSCTFLEYSSCPMKCSSENEVKHYEGDCKAYVICLSGIAYYHKCPPNMKFDKTELTCVPDSVSKCEDDPRLLTKTVNPSTVCRDIELKVGTKTWCNFFEANTRRTYNP